MNEAVFNPRVLILKGHGFSRAITGRIEIWALEAAEKGLGRGKFQYLLLQGLKPNVDLMGVIGTTEVVP